MPAWSLAGGWSGVRATVDSSAQRTAVFVGNLVTDQRIPGLALAVTCDGQPRFKRCWGLAVLSGSSTVDEDSRFCLGSLSKPLLAQTVMPSWCLADSVTAPFHREIL